MKVVYIIALLFCVSFVANSASAADFSQEQDSGYWHFDSGQYIAGFSYKPESNENYTFSVGYKYDANESEAHLQNTQPEFGLQPSHDFYVGVKVSF